MTPQCERCDALRRGMWQVLFPEQECPEPAEAEEKIIGFLESAVAWQGQVTRAHELVSTAIRSHDAHLLMPSLRRGLQDSLDTLCWVLGHPNKSFRHTLEMIEGVLRGVGAEVPAGAVAERVH